MNIVAGAQGCEQRLTQEVLSKGRLSLTCMNREVLYLAKDT